MAYSTGILRNRVTILNRTEATQGRFGLDSSGVEFETAGTVWAEVTWVRGKQAMNVGALDVYGVIMVRMRWNSIVNDRSRVMYDGKTYQILGDTFHAQRQDNTIQFHAQLIVKE
jgi:SPP1 family predicted phage head-tail adaptor